MPALENGGFHSVSWEGVGSVGWLDQLLLQSSTPGELGL